MSEIKPALTAEEWAGARLSREHTYNNAPMIDGMALMVLENKAPQLNRPQAMAALCLHEQSFGFTREDLTLLSVLRSYLPIEHQAAIRDSHNLADRIEALLPPEEK